MGTVIPICYAEGPRVETPSSRQRQLAHHPSRFFTLTVEPEEALLAGLAALMDAQGRQPLQLRLSMLDRIGRAPTTGTASFFLTNVVEVYFELKDNEAERIQKALARPEFKEAKKMATSHVERIEEQARNDGALAAKRDTLARLLTRKFGVLPPELETRIGALANLAELDALLDRVIGPTSWVGAAEFPRSDRSILRFQHFVPRDGSARVEGGNSTAAPRQPDR